MRTAPALVALLLSTVLLAGCSSKDVGESQAQEDWAALQAAAGPGGDLTRQDGRTTLRVPDYDLLLTLETGMEWFQDGWRLRMDVVEAYFGEEDQSDDYAGIALTFVCVPGTVALATEGLEAFGGDDVDARASHAADCLDPDDQGKVAAAFAQMDRDVPLDGVNAMLSLTRVPDVAFVSGKEKGGARTNTYEYAAAGVFVTVTAEVDDDRVTFLSLHAEADGAALDSNVALRYGARAPSPAV